MICKTCKEDKNVDDFYVEPRVKSGRRPHCKSCLLERNAKYPKRVPNKQPTYEVKRRSLLKNIEKRRAWERKHYAKQDKAKRNAKLSVTGKAREYANRRRVRKVDAEGSHTEQEWQELKALYGNKCIYPGCSETTRLTRDHVVPLSKGGSDYITNIQPLCKPHNSSKLAKEIDYR